MKGTLRSKWILFKLDNLNKCLIGFCTPELSFYNALLWMFYLPIYLRWPDGTPVLYTNFAENETDMQSGSQCALIDALNSFLWERYDCYGSGIATICQIGIQIHAEFLLIKFEINWFIILFFHEPSLLFSFLSCLKSDSQVKLFSEALKILFSSRLKVVLF